MKQHHLFEKKAVESGADFSSCRNYRYALWRIWDKTLPLVMFIGLNPSSADENEPDPTITRVMGFAKAWGYGGVYMMNCYPLVSTKPEALQDFIDTPFHDIEDLENAKRILDVSRRCKAIVFAWGAFKIVKDSGRDKMFSNRFPDAIALILNKDGSPRHPLYVPGSVKPIRYADQLQ